MRTVNSLGNRLIALILSVIMALGMFPMQVVALESSAVAQIGDTTYDTLADAMAAVPRGANQIAPSEVTTIKLLRDTDYAFDVGTTNGSSTMNLKLDMNGKTLTLAPSVGSVGTKSSGIRVLAYSKLEIINGTILCSNEEEDNVKVGIANYGELSLSDVAVKRGALTLYTINNRGALTLNGKTTVESGSVCAITNDPYDLYYTTNVNASVTCNSSEVAVESMLIERYQRNSVNKGGVELNITAGYFGKIVEDGENAVSVQYNVTCGVIGVSTSAELALALQMVKAGAAYSCPQNPVTIKLLNSMAGSFDVGISNGTAPKNIVLDLNGNTLTLSPSVGSVGTKTSGIRVLAYSKLEIKNGTILCSNEEADNVKVGIANYSDLTLDGVNVKSGKMTIYTINNRGNLTLKGATSVENGKVPQRDYADYTDYIAITNDPYNLYYSSPINAAIHCGEGNVVVGNIQLETYGNKGNIELNITDGSFGTVYQPAAEGSVTVQGAISGGKFDADVSQYCANKFTAVMIDGKYQVQYVKDDQTDFGFSAADAVEITFNDNDNIFTNIALNGKGTTTYSIVSAKNIYGEDDVVAVIDAETGKLTIQKAGIVQVKAVDTGNALFNPAEASYTLVILRDEQEGFGFEEPNPVDKWVGKSYQNIASGGQGMGTVTYAIISGDDIALIDPTTGELTFKSVGTVKVAATKAADESYAEVTATYTVKSIKYPQEGFKFENSNGDICVGFAEGSFTNVATGGNGDGAITYAIISGDEYATIHEHTGVVTFIKAGEVTVAATKAADANYEAVTEIYILTIEKSSQEALRFDPSAPNTIVYQTTAQPVLSVTGGSGTGKVSYTIIEGNEYATIDQSGVITTLKAGGFFTVQVDKASDGGYIAATPITVRIYVEYAEQENFVFDIQKPENVTFNDNDNLFINTASGGLGTGDITYALADEASNAIADIDSYTGELTIRASGIIRVVATKAGDDCYRHITAEYSLKVEKDTPEFTVEDVQLIYGTTEHQINVDTTLGGEGKYLYAIEGENNIGASIDENGKVTFENSAGKVGTITILVTKEEDSQYIEDQKRISLTVSYHQSLAQPTVDGATKNKSGWYTGVVTISAPEGYQISYSNDLTGTTWGSAVTVGTDGDNTKNVYLKKDNQITDAISFESIKIDTVVPTNLAINYATPFWETVLEKITFGIYQASEVTVTFTATDLTSGIDSFIYNIGEKDIVVNKADFTKDENGVAEYEFKISAQFRNKITLKATDIAGWTSELIESAHTLVVDTVSPVLDVKYEFEGSQNLGEIIYSNKQVTVNFEIKESNFDLRNSDPIFMVGDLTVALDWIYDQDAEVWKARYMLSNDNIYDLSLTFADESGNNMKQEDEIIQYTQKIIIDSADPVIGCTYDPDVSVKENIYNTSRTATFTIKESNFDAQNVVLTVAAKDITGAPVEIPSDSYAEYAKDNANWTQDGGVWTLDTAGMKFDVDGIYIITLDYTDLAENAAETYTAEFVIDKTAPTDVTIEYSASIVDKILESVTFGFYKGDVVITVSAKDQTAGVEYFLITYTQDDGANNSNKATYTTENLVAVQDENDKTLFTATHTLEAAARGTVSVDLIDKAGNAAGKNDQYVVVVDPHTPGLECDYTFTSGQFREYDDIYYTKGETKVTFTIEEANFDLSLMTANDETAAPAPVLTVNGEVQDITWKQIAGTDKWETQITLTGNGDYVVELSYTDCSTNAMATYTKEIHIDGVAPKFLVAFDNNDARNENHYNTNRTATIQVTEHNFEPKEVELVVTAQDITGAPVDIASKGYAEYVKDAANWTQDGGVWTLDTAGMKFDVDGIYIITLDYTDLAENAAESYAAEFVIDKTAPDKVTIEYSKSILDQVLETITFGLYKSNVIVKVTAVDQTAGVESFEITYTKQEGTSNINQDSYTTDPIPAVQDENDKTLFTATHIIPANARGTVSVSLIDKAGNEAGAANPVVLVVDQVDPTREVTYTPYKILDAATMLEVETYKEGDNAILYYKDSAVLTFKITEANFDRSLENDATKPVIKVNNEQVDVDWTRAGDVWTATYTIYGDGDYYVSMTYTDLSTNEMIAYNSCKIAIDSTDPEIAVEFVDGVYNQIIDGCEYYKTTQNLKVSVTEHNFLADDVVLKVIAKDIQGNDVNISSKMYADYAKNRDNWTQNGDVWTLNIEGMEFDIDAIYNFELAYDDILDNPADDYTKKFVIDHKAPTNLKIEYSKPVLEKIIEAITFGFYQPDVIVTLTADDITSGVDYFDWTYTKDSGTSNKNADSSGARITSEDIVYSNGGMTATATFRIPANARGYISATVTDRAGNSDSKVGDKYIIVDDIDPVIRVTYEADSKDTLVQFVDQNVVAVDSFEKATRAYYNGNVTAKIVIDEANFFEGVEAHDGVIHNVGICLTMTDDSGEKTVYEYLPVGAVQKYADATPVYITWTHNGDEHSFNIPYADNADYVLQIEYTDLSTNDANISANDGNKTTKTYQSKMVTVDKIDPIVTVEYENKDVIHTIDGRDYFAAHQTATITVVEHNFRDDDFVATIIAEDILGNSVDGVEYSNWADNGDEHTIKISYKVDANYTFDFEYKDLAQNAAAEYDKNLFTVDTTAPENLTVTYSTSVLDKILESVTFGYYNAEMTVTISAEDDTAGIYYFVYSYVKSEGVSNVNKELINDKIEDANNRIIRDGKKFTTSFTIPQLILSNDNQFNGTVRFTAFDRCEYSTEMIDNQRIIVDNIAPTATITYNEPVQNVNNISYYAGNIDAEIVINEANFYSEDVMVTVTKDGTSYPVNVHWVNNSVDIHTGTFTLTEDGDYIVTVEYKDRSSNQMAKYTSNRLTLDTTAPSVSVSNIKNNSANKDEIYGFTMTATDINLDNSTFKPVLSAVVRKNDGTYETKIVSMGDMMEVEAGKTYTFTVENLEEDAIYSLVCTLMDMSGNQYDKILLSDNMSYDEVRFSINRNGSTFAVDENTNTLVNQYYVYSVNQDVVIEEVNVDPVETYLVKLNGQILTEGTDYTTTMSDKNGEWSKRTYVISKDLFVSEGEYSIVVESTDKAQTTAYSDVKNLNVSFVVDQTAPVLTISGLENNGRYQVEEQTVTIIPTDDGGRLYSMKIIVLNSDGEPLKDDTGRDISVRFDMSGEEFLTYLTENGGKVTFTVPEGLENQVQIICNDYAVNADGITNVYNQTYTKVTISQSEWIIFYANKSLFYGTIAGVLLLVGGLIALILFNKKRKAAKK